MKKVLCMAGVLVVFLAGCVSGSSFTKGSVEQTTDHSWMMTYERFDGSRELSVVPPDGQAVDFEVSVTTGGGTLSLTITGDSGELYYQGTELPSSVFTVYAEGSSKYVVRVEAKAHEGGFSVAWDAAE